MERIETLVFLIAFFLFVVSGMRNRPGPRWLAIAGLAALPLSLQTMWWKIGMGCYVIASLVPSFTSMALIAVMFIHHAVRPGVATITGGRRLHPALALVWLPIARSCINVVKWQWLAKDSGTAKALGVMLTRISWAEVLLLPVAVGVWLRRRKAAGMMVTS